MLFFALSQPVPICVEHHELHELLCSGPLINKSKLNFKLFQQTGDCDSPGLLLAVSLCVVFVNVPLVSLNINLYLL